MVWSLVGVAKAASMMTEARSTAKKAKNIARLRAFSIFSSVVFATAGVRVLDMSSPIVIPGEPEWLDQAGLPVD